MVVGGRVRLLLSGFRGNILRTQRIDDQDRWASECTEEFPAGGGGTFIFPKFYVVHSSNRTDKKGGKVIWGGGVGTEGNQRKGHGHFTLQKDTLKKGRERCAALRWVMVLAAEAMWEKKERGIEPRPQKTKATSRAQIFPQISKNKREKTKGRGGEGRASKGTFIPSEKSPCAVHGRGIGGRNSLIFLGGGTHLLKHPLNKQKRN